MGDKKLLPPKFSEDRPYDDWKRLVSWWKIQTDIAADKQGLAIASSLQGKALDDVLQLDDKDINCATGADNVIKQLDAIFKKNSLTQKIDDIEKFEKLRRTDNSTIKEYILDFEKCICQLKAHKIEYPKDVKGYKLLKGANLPPNEEKMIRASCTDIEYDSVHKKLKSMYGDDKPSECSYNLKTEPTFYAEAPDYGEGRAYEYEGDEDDDVGDVMYASRQRRGNFRGGYSNRGYLNRPNQTPHQPYNNNNNRNPASNNWRDKIDASTPRFRGKNPLSKFGTQTKCRICQSINHWESKCPDKETSDVNFMINEVVLHASNDVVLKILVAETWSCAVLDSGATNTVCGNTWFNEFRSSLPIHEQEKIKMYASSKPFRFGDGVVVNSDKMATIPAVIGDKCVSIATDIVDADIPLLLSEKAMKNGNMSIDFGTDQMQAFGQTIPLQTATNGLYALPITKPNQLINKFCRNEEECPVVLKVQKDKSDKEIAKKLHRCFAHPSADRLLRMVNAAGEKWSNDDNLKKEIRMISEQCEICKMFKKPPARPAVGLPMASEFNEVVAMDLKQYDGKQILHLVDLCKRLSAAVFIPNKKASTVVK